MITGRISKAAIQAKAQVIDSVVIGFVDRRATLSPEDSTNMAYQRRQLLVRSTPAIFLFKRNNGATSPAAPGAANDLFT